MKKPNNKMFKQMLEARRAEMLSHQNTQGLAVEKVADTMDEITQNAQRSLTVETLSRRAGLLRGIEEALDRIEDGSYGTCLSCQEPISVKRLTALPWAELCINCQQATEERSQEVSTAAGAAPASGGSMREEYSLSRNAVPRLSGTGTGHKPGARL